MKNRQNHIDCVREYHLQVQHSVAGGVSGLDVFRSSKGLALLSFSELSGGNNLWFPMASSPNCRYIRIAGYEVGRERHHSTSPSESNRSRGQRPRMFRSHQVILLNCLTTSPDSAFHSHVSACWLWDGTRCWVSSFSWLCAILCAWALCCLKSFPLLKGKYRVEIGM